MVSVFFGLVNNKFGCFSRTRADIHLKVYVCSMMLLLLQFEWRAGVMIFCACFNLFFFII